MLLTFFEGSGKYLHLCVSCIGWRWQGCLRHQSTVNNFASLSHVVKWKYLKI